MSNEKKISLQPLAFDEAITDLLKVKPPKKVVAGDIARAKVRRRREAGLCGSLRIQSLRM
jgi:hypothetical protein